MVWSIGRVIGGCLVDAKPVLSKDESYPPVVFAAYSLESYLSVMVPIFECMISNPVN